MRLRRLAVRAGLGIVVASVVPIAILREVPPVTSAFMLAVQWPFARGDDACAHVDYEWVPRRAISPNVFRAVIAAEDQRFAEHSGFDFDAIEQALEEAAKKGRSRGASTISQQVAKNLLLWSGHNFVRKGLEAWLTLWIEVLWPKGRILEVYVNVAQFGRCTSGWAPPAGPSSIPTRPPSAASRRRCWLPCCPIRSRAALRLPGRACGPGPPGSPGRPIAWRSPGSAGRPERGVRHESPEVGPPKCAIRHSEEGRALLRAGGAARCRAGSARTLRRGG